ncbi:QcrA and Rieske domain-containing protein [Chitinophaga deserti]|uniref:QcrA and Rieske domain-containing protein n=1 Tax=Chitinophaga deserti TaxID=2164099 RepID=UPI00130017C5|nr:Rieske (2Fe-2S) protein [Chitinophaga deserti]
MERREFLSGVSATLAVICVGGLAACGGKGDDPGPANPPGGGGGGNPKLTVNLANQLTTVGSFTIASGVVLIRLAAGNVPASFAALTSTCTHMGCTLSDVNGGKIICGSTCGHGSQFNTDGSVAMGPATNALAKYTVSISGNTLTVT